MRKNKKNNVGKTNKPQKQSVGNSKSNVGKVYRGKTKYIDTETKEERDYAVIRESPRGVSVAKVKSIKRFDENGKNADRALVEINYERYGLPKRTGIDFQVFSQNRMSGKPLRIDDKKVFPEEKERYTLSNRDRDKALYHTGTKKRNKGKKKR